MPTALKLSLAIAVVVDSFAYVYQSSGKAVLSRSQMRESTSTVILGTILMEPFFMQAHSRKLGHQLTPNRQDIYRTFQPFSR